MKLPLQKLNLYIVIVISALTFSSCEIINPSEEIPFYLRIDSISFLDTNKNPIGPAKIGTQRIVDAWVYVDGIFVGTYELPATFPVLASAGQHKISISPGVLVNGQNSDRRIYPFFKNYSVTIDTELGKTDTIKPVTTYDLSAIRYPPNATGQFPETFEGIGTIFKYTQNSKVDTIYRTDADSLVFDGNFSMLMEMDDTKDYMEFETIDSYLLPNNLRPTYLDFNYRTDVGLTIGIYAIDNTSGNYTDINFITLFSTEGQWKKAYLNVSADLSAHSNATYKFYFKANHNSGTASSKVLLDNFRIMYK